MTILHNDKVGVRDRDDHSSNHCIMSVLMRMPPPINDMNSSSCVIRAHTESVVVEAFKQHIVSLKSELAAERTECMKDMQALKKELESKYKVVDERHRVLDLRLQVLEIEKRHFANTNKIIIRRFRPRDPLSPRPRPR